MTFPVREGQAAAGEGFRFAWARPPGLRLFAARRFRNESESGTEQRKRHAAIVENASLHPCLNNRFLIVASSSAGIMTGIAPDSRPEPLFLSPEAQVDKTFFRRLPTSVKCLLIAALSAMSVSAAAPPAPQEAEPGEKRPAPSFVVKTPQMFEFGSNTRCITWGLPSFSVESLRLRTCVFEAGVRRDAAEMKYGFNPGEWEDNQPREGELLVMLRTPDEGRPTLDAAVSYPDGWSADTPVWNGQGDRQVVFGRGLNPRQLNIASTSPRPDEECAVLVLTLNHANGLTILREPVKTGYDLEKLTAESKARPDETVVGVTLLWKARK